MNNVKKMLIFECLVSIFAGFLAYRFYAKDLSFENTERVISSSVAIMALIGLIMFRFGLSKSYKNKSE